jgi:hypothetical protein
VRGGAIRDHRTGQGLGQLRRVGDPEEVDLGGIAAAAGAAREGGLAYARLARAARPRDDQVSPGLEPGGKLADVVAATYELRRRKR